ncbi:unnamed protein product [marine sediment metagenome]|uniref:Uncharacterized protein n=1 Tax=marine sediment metagenome TaxID=412755 RepID=X1I5I2_9ZZZZ
MPAKKFFRISCSAKPITAVATADVAKIPVRLILKNIFRIIKRKLTITSHLIISMRRNGI